MKPTKEYRVRWEIDVDAETPRKAAEEARKIQLDNESIANVFDVFGSDVNARLGRETVDLNVISKPPAGMYLHLFHGRKRYPKLSDWGVDGPYIGPLRWAHTTYHNHIRFEVLEGSGDGIGLAIVEDLVYYKNMYYGDWSWFYYDGVNDWEGGTTAPIANPDPRDFDPTQETRTQDTASQVIREKIINTELVIERDNIKRQRDELAAALADNQQAWEGEEDSVQEEHRSLMKRNEVLLAKARP